MAFTTLIMKNKQTNDIKNAPVGFSWTGLFFGFFVPLFRKHYSAAAFWLVLAVITGGLAWCVFPFIYNKKYIKYLVDKGYQVRHSEVPLDIIESKLKITLPELEE
ncbi:MAG: hypothetical protein COA45_12535 [Zetaproteobacteria bacterium]|nr:MAG: hypothetical protein COA45_12535 [Zetaproteobacteria bacterium]